MQALPDLQPPAAGIEGGQGRLSVCISSSDTEMVPKDPLEDERSLWPHSTALRFGCAPGRLSSGRGRGSDFATLVAVTQPLMVCVPPPDSSPSAVALSIIIFED